MFPITAEPDPANNGTHGVKFFLQSRGPLCVSTDPGALDLDAILGFLAETKWWPDLSRESLLRAVRNSLCFSLREDGRQVGFARVISDFVTYAYLCDVFIVEDRRRQGLGTWLIRSVLEHPDLAPLKRISLITHDAQEFYRPFHFAFPQDPHAYMERLR